MALVVDKQTAKAYDLFLITFLNSIYLFLVTHQYVYATSSRFSPVLWVVFVMQFLPS